MEQFSLQPIFKLHAKQRFALKQITNNVRYTLLHGGARSGKTYVALFYCIMRALKYRKERILICRQHLADIKGSIINDTLLPLSSTLNPDFGRYVRKNLNKQDWVLRFPNESEIWFAGLGNADQVEKILGREFSLIYVNEIQQILYDTIVKLFTRLSLTTESQKLTFLCDTNPTTMLSWVYKLFIALVDPEDDSPKNEKLYQTILMNPIDNPFLSKDYIDDVLMNLSERGRRRFMMGEWLEEVFGALWQRKYIQYECIKNRSDYQKVVAAVDPAVTINPKSNETGIVICSKYEQNGHVLDDMSGKYTPKQWVDQLVIADKKYKLDNIVVEVNQGGDLVKENIKLHARELLSKVKEVRAGRGQNKSLRAEPIVALYEHNRIKHVKKMPKLEQQMTNWTIDELTSPDRIDALVWGFHDLFVNSRSSIFMIA